MSSRIPVRPLPYDQKGIATTKELLIDYTNGNMYIVSDTDSNTIYAFNGNGNNFEIPVLPFTTTLTIGSADNAVSAVTEISRAVIYKRISINCRDKMNLPIFPTSAVTITIWKTTAGVRTSVYTTTISAADKVDTTIAITMLADDLLDITVGEVNGLVGTINCSLRGT